MGEQMKHCEIEQMCELCHSSFIPNIYCPGGERINLLHTSEMLATKYNDDTANLNHQR